MTGSLPVRFRRRPAEDLRQGLVQQDAQPGWRAGLEPPGDGHPLGAVYGGGQDMWVKVVLRVGAEAVCGGLGQRALDRRQGHQVLGTQFRCGDDQADPGRPLGVGLVGAGVLSVECPDDCRRQRLSRRPGAQRRRDPAGPGNGE
jgi:hypothetical protein